MKCPNCGAIIENGKTRCFLCGFDLTGEEEINAPSFANFQPDANGFGSGAGINREFAERKETYEKKLKEYKEPTTKKQYHGEKKDIFDFYSENKKSIQIVLFLLIVCIGVFVIWKVYESKTNPKKKPLVNNLYYEISDAFITTKDTNTEKAYSITGTKGSDCSISISYGASTSSDHVKEYYEAADKILAPAKDKAGNIIDEMQVYESVDNEQIINGATWYYRSIFYRRDASTTLYTQLRYRYYTSLYKGYYYDIVLVNNSNNSTCSVALDNFTKSLSYID